MRSADSPFLPLHNLPPGMRATIVPGKTYEYLASGMPILAALPPGDARDILIEAGNAPVVRPDDVEGLSAAILSAVERSNDGLHPPAPRAEVVGRFEYRMLAADLAHVFDEILGPVAAPPLACRKQRRPRPGRRRSVRRPARSGCAHDGRWEPAAR